MLVNDGLANVVANLGTAKDKASATTWFVRPHTPEEFERMYRSGWLGRKIIDIPVDDMTRRWRGWSADNQFMEAIEAQEKRFGVRARMTAAKRWGRLYGSSAIIVGANPRLGEPSEPLDIGRMQKGDLAYLHVDISPRLLISEWEADIASPLFGQPRLYTYNPVVRGGLSGLGTSVKIHASRVIPFAGAPLPPMHAMATNDWGDSIFTAIEDTLNTSGTVSAVIASLLHEAKIDAIKTNLEGIGTKEGEARIIQRFQLASMLKSINNTLLLGSDEDYQQRTYNFAGLSDIHIRAMQEISGAADIPVTRLLGQAPAGLQSTGESDLRNYYDAISAKQETDLRPALERLDAILCADAGIEIPDGAFFHFHSLWQETATQKAENAFKRAQAVKLLKETDLIPGEVLSEAVVSQLVDDGTYPSLDEAMKAYKETRGELETVTELPDDEDEDDSTNVIPFRQAAQDAAPRSLYVSRKVTNAAEIIAWARGQGIPNLTATGDLHVTVMYSRDPVDWFGVGTAEERILVPRGGPRMVDRFDGGAIVLCFSDWSLRWRHESLREAGASWDHDEFTPHITVAKVEGDFDLSKVEPYQGKIVLGPETFAEVDDDWQSGVAAE
ncbi:anti-CBASS protein Acb1 family protein [Methylorubrum extorquens]|uniref:Anti-CBASS protein Acb1 n=1 Tax=Methylorubrum extorquens DSM 13060 TaxID=882800 RepID=H1KC77_METEX|nr:anti-CBASS Acb1 family protein [Methylorubrum extorquens]EHP94894.1 phage-associated protein, HI1409 family [Methylorubrum extorquens DSM 13060]